MTGEDDEQQQDDNHNQRRGCDDADLACHRSVKRNSRQAAGRLPSCEPAQTWRSGRPLCPPRWFFASLGARVCIQVLGSQGPFSLSAFAFGFVHLLPTEAAFSATNTARTMSRTKTTTKVEHRGLPGTQWTYMWSCGLQRKTRGRVLLCPQSHVKTRDGHCFLRPKPPTKTTLALSSHCRHTLVSAHLHSLQTVIPTKSI